MRILYIDQYFSTRDGISGTRSYEFSRRLVRQGHQVTVLTTASRYSSLYPQQEFLRREKIEGIDVVSLRISYSHMMSFGRRIWSFASFMLMSALLGIFTHRHDVVVATSTPLTVGLPGWLISRVRGTPFVFEVRDLWPRAPIELGIIKNPIAIGILRAFEKHLYRAAHRIITLSLGMAEGIFSAGTPESKVTVVPNASDLDLFDELPSKEELRSQLDLGKEPVVLYAGTVGLANDLTYLVDVAAEMKTRGSAKATFLIVGEGNDLARVQQRVNQSGVEDWFDFRGPVGRGEAAKYMAAADLGVTLFAKLPVLATNSPNKFFDYLAAGLPCAINNNGWIADLLCESGAGVVLPDDSPGDAASILADLLQDKKRMAATADHARELARQEFSREGLLDDWFSALESGANERAWGLEYVLKSAIDYIGAALLLGLLSPVIAVIAWAIARESEGPVFYRQERAGRAGRPFSIFKFRTMVQNAEKMGLGLNIEEKDSRITNVGRFLREWSLDEVPQLFNVLAGQMSLIGPRPALVAQAEKFDERQKLRLRVKPGLTGWSQVNGRNSLSWARRIEKDVEYVENFSLAMDLRILFKTISVVISKKGLYEQDAGQDDSFNQF